MNNFTTLTKHDGPLVSKVYVEQPAQVTDSAKAAIRDAIINQVGDKDDNLADISKMVSLLTTVTSRIYSTLSDTQKSKIATADRELIEYTLSTFASTTTWADIQMATEGKAMIDKILGRQASIATIVSSIKK